MSQIKEHHTTLVRQQTCRLAEYQIQIAQHKNHVPDTWLSSHEQLTYHVQNLILEMSESDIKIPTLLYHTEHILRLFTNHPGDPLFAQYLSLCNEAGLLKLGEGLLVNLPMVMAPRHVVGQINQALEHEKTAKLILWIIDEICSEKNLSMPNEASGTWWNTVAYTETLKQQLKTLISEDKKFDWEVIKTIRTSMHPGTQHQTTENVVEKLSELSQKLAYKKEFNRLVWSSSVMTHACDILQKEMVHRPNNMAAILDQSETVKTLLMITVEDLMLPYTNRWIVTLAEAFMPNDIALNKWLSIWESICQKHPAIQKSFAEKYDKTSTQHASEQCLNFIHCMMQTSADKSAYASTKNSPDKAANSTAIAVQNTSISPQKPNAIMATQAPTKRSSDNNKPMLIDVVTHLQHLNPKTTNASLLQQLLHWVETSLATPKYQLVAPVSNQFQFTSKTRHDVLIYLYQHIQTHAAMFPASYANRLHDLKLALESKPPLEALAMAQLLKKESLTSSAPTRSIEAFLNIWIELFNIALNPYDNKNFTDCIVILCLNSCYSTRAKDAL